MSFENDFGFMSARHVNISRNATKSQKRPLTNDILIFFKQILQQCLDVIVTSQLFFNQPVYTLRYYMLVKNELACE